VALGAAGDDAQAALRERLGHDARILETCFW
jgi:hypothetical protein